MSDSISVPQGFRQAEFINEGDGKFASLLVKHKLNAEEYQRLRSILGRVPTLSELGVFSAMWSEHCSYKSSRMHLKRLPTEGPHVVVGPGENAGVVRLKDKLCVAFKMESHNHPSYIEPYQGAATGVGGILRDVFCMGARPVANLNCLRFGRRSHQRTQHLVENVVRGIGDYGNCVGVPTVGGNISFDATYDGNCLVNAMTVGVIHEDKIFKGYASGVGNYVVYVGSATGRDGIHGATMASDSFQSQESGERSTIQVGDPFMEKLLMEATLELLDAGLVVGLQDMGAAGLTSSSFEMAARANNGLYLDLEKVPVRAKNMTAYELLLSESQERMLMVIRPPDWPAVREVLERWQLAFAIIGQVTDSGRLRASYHGLWELDVPVAPLTDAAPRYDRPRRPRPLADQSASAQHFSETLAAISRAGVVETLLTLLADVGLKTQIYRQYDQHVGTKTVSGPDSQGAAVLWMRSEWTDAAYLGLAIATACNERYVRVNPRLGAAHAVAKAARMIAASGGEPLAVTDCLNFGNPELPEVMAEFADAVDGIADACRELSTPVVSGNVSLYNDTDGQSIFPTPMIGMVGVVDDVRRTTLAVAKAPGRLYLLFPKDSEPAFGGSAAAKLLLAKGQHGAIPAINWDAERESLKVVRRLAQDSIVAAVRDVGEGGLAVVATKLCVSGGLGLRLSCEWAGNSNEQVLTWLFGELAGAYVLLVSDHQEQTLLKRTAELESNRVLAVGAALHRASGLTLGPWRLAYEQAAEALASLLKFSRPS